MVAFGEVYSFIILAIQVGWDFAIGGHIPSGQCFLSIMIQFFGRDKYSNKTERGPTITFSLSNFK